jgi:hypothetical protein
MLFAFIYFDIFHNSDSYNVEIGSRTSQALKRESQIFYPHQKKYILGSEKESAQKRRDGELSLQGPIRQLHVFRPSLSGPEYTNVSYNCE